MTQAKHTLTQGLENSLEAICANQRAEIIKLKEAVNELLELLKETQVRIMMLEGNKNPLYQRISKALKQAEGK